MSSSKLVTPMKTSRAAGRKKLTKKVCLLICENRMPDEYRESHWMEGEREWEFYTCGEDELTLKEKNDLGRISLHGGSTQKEGWPETCESTFERLFEKGSEANPLTLGKNDQPADGTEQWKWFPGYPTELDVSNTFIFPRETSTLDEVSQKLSESIVKESYKKSVESTKKVYDKLLIDTSSTKNWCPDPICICNAEHCFSHSPNCKLLNDEGGCDCINYVGYGNWCTTCMCDECDTHLSGPDHKHECEQEEV